VVHLEISRLIGDIGIGRCVGFIEAVSRKFLHQVENFSRNRFLDVAFSGALNKNSALTLHFLDVLFTHGATQQVCAAKRVAANHLGDSHHLFLINHDAVGFLEHRLHALVKVFHFLSAEFSVNKGRNQIHRARTIERV